MTIPPQTHEAAENAARDAALLAACRRGDGQAWEELLDRYERLVFSIPRSHGLPAEDAADVAQLTFTAFLERIDTLRDDSNLGAWLATVARRYTWRAVSRGRREQTDADTPIPETAVLVGRAPSDDAERWELAEWVHLGLASLSERCRELLSALYFEPAEPQYAEVAARLGMPVGSVGPTRARCLERLRAILSGELAT